MTRWPGVLHELEAEGAACLGRVLDDDSCDALVALYADDGHFRSRVVMARHGYGQGEYKYLSYPLPSTVATLRAELYARLVPVANAWRAGLGSAEPFPTTHEAYLARCHDAGQTRPTPLLLRYGPGDYNCLHQDLYGALHFPLQVVVLLSAPGQDFAGGELAVTEQRPRRQSRVQVLPLAKGEAAAFAVNRRPVAGARGTFRATMRHGVSKVLRGERYTLGIIFHDAA